MKTKAPSKKRSQASDVSGSGQFMALSQAERLRRIHEWWDKLGRLPKAKRRARMIELGMLTPRRQGARLSHGPCAAGTEGVEQRFDFAGLKGRLLSSSYPPPKASPCMNP